MRAGSRDGIGSVLPSFIAAVLVLSGCSASPQPPAKPKTVDEALREQIIPCWAFDAGVKHPENDTVVIRARFRPDGSVTDAQVVDPAQRTDPEYLAAAESALRVFFNPSCVPIHFPDGHYLPEADFVFDLEKAINGGY